ncbi:MAG: uncharacterized protein A8A55_2719 [Amphiamblys sp. WSBS2006]|nr:MAG: uncharacterized protein A8A55_2719 [Amphiamblys sp. WSBS2006]
MQIFSVLLAAISVCVYTLDSDFAYVSENVLLKFPEEQEREIYVLREETSPNRLCSVLFMPVSRDKTAPSSVSLLRFLYDEAEARTRCQEAGDIAREVSSFLAEHAAVDARTGTVWVVSQNTQAVFQLTEQKMFFVSFQNGELSVQAVPEGIAEVSVPRIKESGIDYLYKKEKEHGNIFDNFLIAEECKREKKKNPQLPGKKKRGCSSPSLSCGKRISDWSRRAPRHARGRRKQMGAENSLWN